jgi:hypothetical protein
MDFYWLRFPSLAMLFFSSSLGIGGGSVGGSGGPNWGRTASSASPKRKEEPKKGRAGDKIKEQSHKST